MQTGGLFDGGPLGIGGIDKVDPGGIGQARRIRCGTELVGMLGADAKDPKHVVDLVLLSPQ